MRMNFIRSPLRWAGGKARVAKLIAAALPKHHTYVEPFGGGASVLLAKAPSEIEVYNDLDGELVNFFRVLKNDPEGFLKTFEWSLVARSEYDRLASLDPADLSPLERAHRFYYLVMAGWGAESGRFRFQVSKRDRGGGNRLIGALATLEERIRPVHVRLQRVIIENRPWQKILKQYDDPNTVFYLDPPYPGHQVSYGRNMAGLESHRELWLTLGSLRGRWLLTTYDDPELRSEMRGALGDVHFHPLKMQWGMPSQSSGAGQELLVADFEIPPEVLHHHSASAPTPPPLFEDMD